MLARVLEKFQKVFQDPDFCQETGFFSQLNRITNPCTFRLMLQLRYTLAARQGLCCNAAALLQHYCSATAALRPKPVKLKLLIGLLSGLGPVHNNSGKALAQDRKSTRLNSSHLRLSRMPSSA